jgi:hypothetical protein
LAGKGGRRCGSIFGGTRENPLKLFIRQGADTLRDHGGLPVKAKGFGQPDKRRHGG